MSRCTLKPKQVTSHPKHRSLSYRVIYFLSVQYVSSLFKTPVHVENTNCDWLQPTLGIAFIPKSCCFQSKVFPHCSWEDRQWTAINHLTLWMDSCACLNMMSVIKIRHFACYWLFLAGSPIHIGRFSFWFQTAESLIALFLSGHLSSLSHRTLVIFCFTIDFPHSFNALDATYSPLE